MNNRSKKMVKMATERSPMRDQINHPMQSTRSPSPCPSIEGTPSEIADLMRCLTTPSPAIIEEEFIQDEMPGLSVERADSLTVIATSDQINTIRHYNEDKTSRPSNEEKDQNDDASLPRPEPFRNTQNLSSLHPDLPPQSSTCSNSLPQPTSHPDSVPAPPDSPSSYHDPRPSSFPSVSSAVSLEDKPSNKSQHSNRVVTRKRKLKKPFVDFLSDNDEADLDFEWDSSSWKGTSSSESDMEADDRIAKRCKKRKKNDSVANENEDDRVGERGLKKKKINKRLDRKRLRQSGQSFERDDGSVKSPKTMKNNPCRGKKCQNNCEEISEEKRQSIFKYYWNLDPQRRRDWLVTMSIKMEVKRKRQKESSRRSHTYTYFINDGEGRRQVCQQFILATLDISQTYVYYTLSNSSNGMSKNDMRGKVTPSNKTKEDVVNALRKYIKELPAVPSHYCRNDSTKLYLPTEFKNISHLYNLYKKDLTEKKMDVVGEKIFRNIFVSEFNIGFHIPKKDKCTKCVGFKNNPDNYQKQAITDHLKEKEYCDKRFNIHKKIHKDNKKILCTSFDLQKVLQTPHGQSMLLYYSRKYAQFNLTFYECGTREGFCYNWGESEGKRGANEVATILAKYIKMVDARESVVHLLLYSDSCSGQNKNKTILATIHYTLQNCTNLQSIQINYLLPGHTNMPVDSMHAVIENSTRGIIVWAPSQWATIFELARKHPKPYTVETLTHKDFVGWDNITDKYFRGNLIGKISKIRVATFKKNTPTKMSVKMSMSPSATIEEIDVYRSKLLPTESLYKSSLPISKQKYTDLVRLCNNNTIPKQYHKEYLSLPSSTVSVRDTLYDSDVEDQDAV